VFGRRHLRVSVFVALRVNGRGVADRAVFFGDVEYER